MGALNQGGDRRRAADKEEAELNEMDKAIAAEATTKVELEVMVDIYCSFIDAGFYLFFSFKPLLPKQIFSSKIQFLKGFYFFQFLSPFPQTFFFKKSILGRCFMFFLVLIPFPPNIFFLQKVHFGGSFTFF